MKIVSIKKIEETKNYYFTEITFSKKPLFRKRVEFIKNCVTDKRNIGTDYLDTGRTINVQFWSVVTAFLETTENYIKIK